MANHIHDFIVTDHAKNPSKELIISQIAGALSDISKEMIPVMFFQVYPKHEFFILVQRNHFPYEILWP